MAKRNPHRTSVPNPKAWSDPTAKKVIEDDATDADDHPQATTVYYLHNAEHELLYVGISASQLGISRFQQHAADKDWWPEVAYISLEHMPTEHHARHREAAAITHLNPRYNAMRPNYGACINCGTDRNSRNGPYCSACYEYRRRNGVDRPEHLFAALKHSA